MAASVRDKGLYYEELAQTHDWDEVTNNFETDRRLKLIFDRLLQNVDLQGAKFLDGGSGGGHFSAEAVRRGAVVTSLDVGEALLKQVAQRCNSTRVVGSLLNLPFDDHSFDVVMSSEVIEHTDDPRRAVKELARVLRPGGYLVVTSPGRLWQPVVRAASALKLRRYQGNENFLWPSTAARIVRESGIDILQLCGFNILPIFSRRFARLLNAGDLLGRRMPAVYVNYAVFGRRPAAR
jgi:2-polyprenyl-3-methyl-5-hydroxy-6-metoxy-1,4-benzoquinol methylase